MTSLLSDDSLLIYFPGPTTELEIEMAHWFHRNPLKATQPVKFESLKKASKGGAELLTQLKVSRARLLELISSSSTTADDITTVSTEYLSLLRGLVDNPTAGGDSKLRHVTPFKWTNSLGGRVPSVRSDAAFELVSIVMDIAIWYTKHAAAVAATDTISMDEAKDVHRCLKISAGMFLGIKENLLPRLPASPEKGVDSDPRVVEAYAQQSQGEAQEVTLARALELGHKPAVIYALSLETSKLFTLAADSLKTLDPSQFAKWNVYLQLKATFYESYAYCFLGQELLAQEKCGDSIRALLHSQSLSDRASKLCDKYARIKGAGSIARPEHHPFFQKLAPMVKLHLEKSQRENGFIYYHKIPEELPEIPHGQVYGLASPDDFSLPPHHQLWTEEVYAAFVVPEKKEESSATPTGADASKEEIPPVMEPNIAPGKLPQPETKSGCVVS